MLFKVNIFIWNFFCYPLEDEKVTGLEGYLLLQINIFYRQCSAVWFQRRSDGNIFSLMNVSGIGSEI